MSKSLHTLWKKLNRAYPGMYVNPGRVSGEYSVYIRKGSERKLVLHKDNLLLYTWGWIAAKCIATGDTAYKVAGGYLEFENNQTAGAVTVPSYTREDELSYYNALTGDKDFLRLALDGTPTLDQHPDYVSLLPTGSVNRATFSLTGVGGSTGIRGKTFSNANQSVAYGVALVATPLLSDRTQDVILSRGYFDLADQVEVPTGGQVEVDWLVAFK